MSATEICGRITERLHSARERCAYRLRPNRRRGLSRVAIAAKQLRSVAAALIPGCQDAELTRLKATHPEFHRELEQCSTQTADRILSGSWPLLDRTVDLTGKIDWHRDPQSDHTWRRTFYADLELSKDVKYVWELNRHQFLAELAQAWLFTGKEHYAARVRELILDWIVENPLYEGVNWTSALEVAVRAISWLWTMAALAEWAGWETDDCAKIAQSLVDHGTYLEHHLSFCTSPYNHLIGEASGLYFLGRWLRAVPEASRWETRGRSVLEEHGPLQFYRDGFCVEQATGYHFFTLGFLVQAVVAGQSQGKPLSALEPVVAQAFHAGGAFQQPDGRWPAIGDVDSARSIPVHHDDFWDFRSLCSLGAVVFDDPELKSACDSPGEELYWLLGTRGIAAWHALGEARRARCTVLAESGYAVAASADEWLLFDAGPIAEGLHRDATPSTAHGHADTLQVLFWMNNRPMLIDSGMPFYDGPEDWVRHFRSPGAHNTLQIEGVQLVQDAGRLDWSHAVERPRLDVNLSDQGWLARGSVTFETGRGRKRSRVLVERYLLGLPGQGLWMADWIETDRPRRVRWFWQLPAGTVERIEDNRSKTCVIAGDKLVLAMWSDSSPLHARIEAASDDSPVGWSSPGYGVRRSGQRVCQEAEAASRLLVASYLGNSPMPTAVTIRGHRLICAPDHDALPLFEAAPDQARAAGAEAVWRVFTERGLVTYLCGGDGHGTRLHGTGNWPTWSSCNSESMVPRRGSRKAAWDSLKQ